jgi:hypothetical protein
MTKRKRKQKYKPTKDDRATIKLLKKFIIQVGKGAMSLTSCNVENHIDRYMGFSCVNPKMVFRGTTINIRLETR